MTYKPSPRPTFAGPTHIPYDRVTRHLWGDESSGEVADWIYVSSDKIHQLLFGLAPAGAFRHSENFRTIFAADEVLYVLSGVLILANPEVGEVHQIMPGEAAFFRRDTWHHAFNHGAEPLRVLELFAPPPSQGASGAYSRQKPYLEHSKYIQDEWLGHWPEARDKAGDRATIKVLRESDYLWILEGAEQQVLTGILASTEHLTVAKTRLIPGAKGDLHAHDGDECIYVLEGTLNVRTPENEGQHWFELQPQDGFYIPEGTPHQYYNVSGNPVHFICGVAPKY